MISDWCGTAPRQKNRPRVDKGFFSGINSHL
jgi:hypothetical protein